MTSDRHRVPEAIISREKFSASQDVWVYLRSLLLCAVRRELPCHTQTCANALHQGVSQIDFPPRKSAQICHICANPGCPTNGAKNIQMAIVHANKANAKLEKSPAVSIRTPPKPPTMLLPRFPPDLVASFGNQVLKWKRRARF